MLVWLFICPHCVRVCKIAKASYYWRCRDESALLHSKASGRERRKEVGSRLTFPFSKRNKEKGCWSFKKKKKKWGGFILTRRLLIVNWCWFGLQLSAEVSIRSRAAAPLCSYLCELYLCNLCAGIFSARLERRHKGARDLLADVKAESFTNRIPKVKPNLFTRGGISSRSFMRGI